MAGTIRRILAKRLKVLRERRGLTQQGLAERANLDYKHLQSLEGKRPPNVTLDTLERLARALSTSPADLLRS